MQHVRVQHSNCCCQMWSGLVPSQQTGEISFVESQETVHRLDDRCLQDTKTQEEKFKLHQKD